MLKRIIRINTPLGAAFRGGGGGDQDNCPGRQIFRDGNRIFDDLFFTYFPPFSDIATKIYQTHKSRTNRMLYFKKIADYIRPMYVLVSEYDEAPSMHTLMPVCWTKSSKYSLSEESLDKFADSVNTEFTVDFCKKKNYHFKSNFSKYDQHTLLLGTSNLSLSRIELLQES